MSETQYNYFVAAAVIAAKLDRATKVAQQLSLTASNARAVALRAGEGAAGFRPLTDFIDRLADVTVKSSKQINFLAASLSKTAAEKFRADSAISRFNTVYQRAKDSENISSLDNNFNRTKQHQSQLILMFQKQIKQLIDELDELSGELRTAVILATLSRVEASQAGVAYQESLHNVANNVESAASIIKKHIQSSQQLVSSLV
ncbi:chemotaxis protein [Thalassotalea sp. G2M2-11]|uniref:chemotaxis protein n=1 Tax=Thalassotalea sp. G2M2-11 TaxID=2787627 RepID=UPI0019D185DB|nr:chemotaxis protein [Thalassotalea sp. G2M2-11]